MEVYRGVADFSVLKCYPENRKYMRVVVVSKKVQRLLKLRIRVADGLASSLKSLSERKSYGLSSTPPVTPSQKKRWTDQTS